jgi:hypothetical protein
MNKEEARKLLARRITELRSLSYVALQQMQGPNTAQATGPSGKAYQLEIQIFWDDRSRRNLRVMVSVDDMGGSSLAPLSDDFIVAPDGSFLGE